MRSLLLILLLGISSAGYVSSKRDAWSATLRRLPKVYHSGSSVMRAGLPSVPSVPGAGAAAGAIDSATNAVTNGVDKAGDATAGAAQKIPVAGGGIGMVFKYIFNFLKCFLKLIMSVVKCFISVVGRRDGRNVLDVRTMMKDSNFRRMALRVTRYAKTGDFDSAMDVILRGAKRVAVTLPGRRETKQKRVMCIVLGLFTGKWAKSFEDAADCFRQDANKLNGFRLLA